MIYDNLVIVCERIMNAPNNEILYQPNIQISKLPMSYEVHEVRENLQEIQKNSNAQ